MENQPEPQPLPSGAARACARVARPWSRRLTGTLTGTLPLTLLLLLGWGLAGGRAQAQETPETRAFKAAVDSFRTDVFERAEREFRQFVATYPNSPLLPEAILLQARSALQQTNLSAAIALLSANVAKAGQLADQYRYRLATAYHSSSNYAAAAASFLFITTQYTNSPLLLEGPC